MEGSVVGGSGYYNKMKNYYISIKDELQYERKIYAEELGKKDWEYLKKASEFFLVHAYTHLFENQLIGYEVFGDKNYRIKYSQFYLNLAVGLELLLKSMLLMKGMKINLSPEKTETFSNIINRHLSKLFPRLSGTTIEDIRNTFKIINLKRNNIAHLSKRSYEHYAYEHRISYVTLYIFEEYFYATNLELTELLLKSINKSKITAGAEFKPLKIKPRSLRERTSKER